LDEVMARVPHLPRWLWTSLAIVACAALFGGISMVAGRAATVSPSREPAVATGSQAPTSTTTTTSTGRPVAGVLGPTTTTTTTRPAPRGTKVAIVGDSLTEGIRTRLPPLATQYGFDLKIDAQSGRDIAAGMTPLTKIKTDRDLVVVALGTNDARASLTVEAAQARIEQMLAVVGDKTPVLWVNIYRQDTKDASTAARRFDLALDAEAAVRPNLTVLDWSSYIQGRKDLLGKDGIHLTSAGYDDRAAWLARAIADELRLPSAAGPTNER
jgi:lysophospholipase L1-like esterase